MSTVTWTHKTPDPRDPNKVDDFRNGCSGNYGNLTSHSVFLSEDGSAMDTDRSEPHTSPVGHQCVLDTLAAVCTQDSIVHDVIPRLIEDVQHICEGNSND